MTTKPRVNTGEETLMEAIVTGDTSAAIEASEARGQRELVNSASLPVDCGDRAPYEALGFVFGEPDEHDPMFMPAELPEGWTREGSSHAMWSYVLDERGIKRVSIFYKAAFYDRSAHMYITNVGGDVARDFIYGDADEMVLDALTPEERTDAVRALIDYHVEHSDKAWTSADTQAHCDRAKVEVERIFS